MMKKRFLPWILSVLTVAAIGTAVWWLLAKRQGGDAPDPGETSPVAQVRTVPLRRAAIERTLTAYGTAVTAPGGTRSLSFPFECRVVAVPATAGQPVQEGDVLLQIEPSVDARLALDTARSTQNAAETALKELQGRFNARLATNADLAAAQSAARDARLKFDSLQSRTPTADGNVRAPAAGLITSVTARPGVVVPAGSALVEIAVENRVEARLGIAPPDAAQIKAGQPVHLTAVDGDARATAATLAGTVRLVGQSVDPATRMVDGFVSLVPPPGSDAPLLVGTYLRAEIVVEKKDALLAPRDSVLPDAEHPGRATLFTIQSGKAVRHDVGIGIDDAHQVELTGDTAGLADGTPVITEGAYELADGMTVEIATPGPGTGPETGAGTDKPAGGDPAP